jgi:hypothetical protein
LYTAAQSAAARLVAHLTGSEKFSTVAFGTEGGLFHQSGIPSVDMYRQYGAQAINRMSSLPSNS